MKKIKLGSFKSDGNILVTDPCYRKNKDTIRLNVRKGEYTSSILIGKIHSSKYSFRVAEIQITHIKSKKLHFKKIPNVMISVDSGQAGFFNESQYKKKHTTKLELINEIRYEYVSMLKSSYATLVDAKEALRDKKSDKFKEILKICKKDYKQASSFLQFEVSMSKRKIKDITGYLKKNKFPEYAMKPKLSDDFYEIIMDLTLSKFQGGVNSLYGAVSTTGWGDGSYEVEVAKDSRGVIVAAKIKFFDKKEWVKGVPKII